MQLGGGFIGSGGGIIFDALQIPLDPAGRTAALHHKILAWNADTANLIAKFGADTLTEGTGQVEMTGRDTFKLSWVAYAVKQGNPPLIRLIIVLNGAAQFTGPDSYDITSSLYVYTAFENLPYFTDADADDDGFPDPGTTPIWTVSSFNSATRVPIP